MPLRDRPGPGGVPFYPSSREPTRLLGKEGHRGAMFGGKKEEDLPAESKRMGGGGKGKRKKM